MNVAAALRRAVLALPPGERAALPEAIGVPRHDFAAICRGLLTAGRSYNAALAWLNGCEARAERAAARLAVVRNSAAIARLTQGGKR